MKDQQRCYNGMLNPGLLSVAITDPEKRHHESQKEFIEVSRDESKSNCLVIQIPNPELTVIVLLDNNVTQK